MFGTWYRTSRRRFVWWAVAADCCVDVYWQIQFQPGSNNRRDGHLPDHVDPSGGNAVTLNANATAR
jgi:hypothetical protein